jgi:hypothetical protein
MDFSEVYMLSTESVSEVYMLATESVSLEEYYIIIWEVAFSQGPILRQKGNQ